MTLENRFQEKNTWIWKEACHKRKKLKKLGLLYKIVISAFIFLTRKNFKEDYLFNSVILQKFNFQIKFISISYVFNQKYFRNPWNHRW